MSRAMALLFVRLAGQAIACAFALAVLSGGALARGPLIAAASDLQFALPEAVAAFEAQSGQRVEVTFGASGNLARQIRQGAPYEVFLSADEEFALDLAKDGLADGEGVLYARGRLALFVPHGSPLKADGTLDDLAAALADGRLKRFALANPAHAPYGRRTEEVLRHRGLWQAIEPHLVLGESVAQAAHFAASGNAEGGLIAHALAIAPSLAARGTFDLIPETWHSPLNQRMVLLKRASGDGRTFYHFLQSPPAREILGRHGFSAPSGHD